MKVKYQLLLLLMFMKFMGTHSTCIAVMSSQSTLRSFLLAQNLWKLGINKTMCHCVKNVENL